MFKAFMRWVRRMLGIGIWLGSSASTVAAAPAALATPSLNNSSALGASPLVLSVTDADYDAGLYLQLQIDQTSSAFSNLTQNLVALIDGASWAALDEAIGLVTPSGQYWARFRSARDNEIGSTTVTGTDPDGATITFLADVSNWSNTFTDTISASVATWTTTNGTKKSAQLTLTNANLTLQGTTGWGAFQSIAATIAGGSKTQWELTLTALATDSNRTIAFGRYNGTTDFTTVNEPGVNDSNGYAIQFTPGGTNVSVYNAAATQIGNFTLGSAIAAGDVFSDELDVSGSAGSHSITIYRNNVSVGTITGKTLTGFTRAFAMTKSDEKLTANFGGSTFNHTLDTGYLIYG